MSWLCWRLFQTIRIFVISIWRGVVWCGMYALSSFSTSPFVVGEKRNTYHATRRCPWFISAHLSPSIWPQTASCNGQVCPCYTTLLATRVCPAYTLALQPMFWNEPPSSPASSAATSIQLFHSAADSTWWISGCGATDGANPGQYLSRGGRLSGGS